MKTTKEKAEYWLNDNVAGWDDAQLNCLTALLKEQDRDTRHACALTDRHSKNLADPAAAKMVFGEMHPLPVVQIYSNTQQGKKIEYLKNKGGKLLSCVVKVELSDGQIAQVDDWGRVVWIDA